MKFPRKLINRDIGPLNSGVVSHLRTINYTMDGTVIDTRVSVQNPSRVNFFFFPLGSSKQPLLMVDTDRTIERNPIIAVNRSKSIRSNEFNLDPSLDGILIRNDA